MSTDSDHKPTKTMWHPSDERWVYTSQEEYEQALLEWARRPHGRTPRPLRPEECTAVASSGWTIAAEVSSNRGKYGGR